MPATDWGWLITAEELESWILYHDADLLVVNKPGVVVCHPSKMGPWSSLAGAVREHLGVDRVHMPSRLDRETSGVVVIAKNRNMASRLQRAMTRGRVRKTYLAVLRGELAEEVTVDRRLGADPCALVSFKQRVVDAPEGHHALTRFVPIVRGGGFTLARIHPKTGRLHQIRAHAAWMGHAIVGDKLYGFSPIAQESGERMFLEFIRTGITQALTRTLLLPRHALHAAEIAFEGMAPFQAPLPKDIETFCREYIGTGSTDTLQLQLS